MARQKSSLLTDPKARKVILIEHPLLPIYIKDLIARILFENHVCLATICCVLDRLNDVIGALYFFCFEPSSLAIRGGTNNRARPGLRLS